MDPASYARYHGIQGEASKVTVTRMACGELQYRRVVDTYRRDMQSTVTNIRREQGKLRRSMRGYRRKLKESALPHGPVKKISGRKKEEEIDEELNYSKAVNDAALYGGLSAPPVIQHFHEPTVSFVSIDPQPLRGHSELPKILDNRERREDEGWEGEEFVTVHNIDRAKRSVIENVGRTARWGSGKIGDASTSKRIVGETEEDTYSLLSDSSEDEVDDKEKEEDIDVVIFKHGRFLKQVGPGSLVRTKSSAYLKSMPTPDDKTTEETELALDGSGEHNSHALLDSIEGVEKTDSLQVPSLGNVPHSEYDNSVSGSLDPSLLPAHKVPEAKSDEPVTLVVQREATDLKVLERKRKLQKKKTGGISFGDLVKFQHGSNTKKLFALVDRLAEKNGLGEMREEHGPTFARDPRENAALKRRKLAQDNNGPTPNSITTYGSVFYTMKFGYVSDVADGNESSRSAVGSNTPMPDSNKMESLKLKSSQLSPSVYKPQSEYSNYSFDAPTSALSTDFSFLNVQSSDHHDGRALYLSEPNKGHLIRADDTRETDNQAQMIDKVWATNNPAVPTLSNRQGLERKVRKASILEASQFVTDAKASRRRMSRAEPALMPKDVYAKRERDIFRKRGSTKLDHLPTMHQQMADERAMPWSSAFSRIKMVHTLADLTHIL